MLRLLLLAVGAAIVYQIFASIQRFRENLAKAKSSGIPYIWTPIYV